MTPSTDPRIQRAVEGSLSESEWRLFQADVVSNPDLRSAYVEELWLHQSLRSLRAGFPEMASSGEMAPVPQRSLSRGWRLAAGLAACGLLAAGGAILARRSPAPPTVAILTQADNCKWAGSDLPTAVDSKLTAGTLSLVEGIATLSFKSGATVTLEAPSRFQIHDAMHCRLLEGAVTAEVPESAHGFTIDAPDLKVVDLGTRFGLTASAVGTSQVRVFEGEVDVEGLPGGQRRRITKGKGLHVHSGNTLAGQEPVRGQQVHEADGWVSIPTSYGQGKDAYARRSDEGAPLGLQPILIVKHSDIKEGRQNERRAVLSFDVSQIRPADVREAEIVLEPVSSGFGFSALVPDSRFAVYGITDESLDAWEERSLRWARVPACTDEGPDPARTRRLAEFWIPRGGGGLVTARSATLADFIAQDSNGIVSFLIVRETGESDPNGLAHGFGSKEHPNARPPTLRLRALP